MYEKQNEQLESNIKVMTVGIYTAIKLYDIFVSN